MTRIAEALGLAAVLVVGYAYLGYPVLLLLLSRVRRNRVKPAAPAEWPRITIVIPAYNEETVIRDKLERVLQYDYPADRRQILVVSDASSDRTDEIVREFASRGVELLRLPERRGKTGAENAALPHITGSIVVQNDASIRVPPSALKELVRWFADPSVGVASGRDVSVSNVEQEANRGESGYVGYEMWIRRLETRVDGIIGASGCFYATRKELHSEVVPNALSRDFASALIAREHGFRSVSADEAVCYVPRTPSLEKEYPRKVRTMTRGLETLFYKRGLLNPFRYGLFAWMLWSHKLIRWMLPWAALAVAASVVLLAFDSNLALVVLVGGLLASAIGMVGWLFPSISRRSRLVSLPTYIVAGLVASLHAWVKALAGELHPTWEPTRREMTS